MCWTYLLGRNQTLKISNEFVQGTQLFGAIYAVVHDRVTHLAD